MIWLLAIAFHVSTHADTAERIIRVPGGTFVNFLPGRDESPEVSVQTFFIDKNPVTNKEFSEFVRQNPRWRKDRVKALFADKNYLQHWESPESAGSTSRLMGPVVHVSWFAAKAFCEWKKKRLPTTEEWEYAAQLTDDSGKKDELNRIILDWYSKPSRHPLPDVGSAYRNTLGVEDLHGLVWEWTMDFNSVLMLGESRADNSGQSDLFCGGGSLSGKDKENYPAFMRYAFRSSLKGASTVGNLGFRCVRSLESKEL